MTYFAYQNVQYAMERTAVYTIAYLVDLIHYIASVQYSLQYNFSSL